MGLKNQRKEEEAESEQSNSSAEQADGPSGTASRKGIPVKKILTNQFNKSGGGVGGGGGGGGGRSAPDQVKGHTPATRCASAIVIDIIFGTLILYLVYLWLGFRCDYLQAHQWFGLEDHASAHTIDTIFAMAMAAAAREISQPVADLAKATFDHVTSKVPWNRSA